LRVLYLQSDIADKVIAMIKGAMAELTVGNPSKLSTDVGPVIDAEAQAGLLAHIDKMKQRARWFYQTPLTEQCQQGTFVPPTLFEIDNLSDLTREVFGPVLHVLRFEANQLDKVVAEINSTGYGLTHGIHSRIDETINNIVDKIKVGNVYVNRNIVGAVVGVQPFGGEGKSGTGPKAGGPFYLYRLTRAAWAPKLALQPVAANLSGLSKLAAVAGSMGVSGLNARIDAAGRASPLTHQVSLPGPTGEKNTLCFAPRGKVGCVASSGATLAEQLVAVLATGNVAVLADSPANRQLASTLGSHVELTQDVLTASLDAVLYEGEDAARVRQQLAQRDGALIPLILAGKDGYNLHRLVVERAVSVNTTAAGGNASLMSIGD
jgi:RHH-type proline utilization regulon transcriptional repressor/proline dehydrogenase/delta 1-pyrroline-5-carboxylate dehydrogenase